MRLGCFEGDLVEGRMLCCRKGVIDSSRWGNERNAVLGVWSWRFAGNLKGLRYILTF